MDDRMILHKDDIQMLDENGNVIPAEKVEEYYKQKELLKTKVFEKLNIGDVVEISNIDVPIIITACGSDPVLIGFDYAGADTKDSENWILFNQSDIENIISKNSESNFSK